MPGPKLQVAKSDWMRDFIGCCRKRRKRKIQQIGIIKEIELLEDFY